MVLRRAAFPGAKRGHVQSVMPAVWAYAACDDEGMVCGGADNSTAWLQPQLVLTSSGVVKQPSWHAHSVIARGWGDTLLAATPNRTADSGDASTLLDVLALGRERDGSVMVHATYTGAEPRALTVKASFGHGATACAGSVVSEVLAAANISAINTQHNPSNVIPVQGVVVVVDGVARTTLPPHSLSSFALAPC